MLVFVGAKDPSKALSPEDLRLIFQARKKTWPDGRTAIPFNLPHDHRTRHIFDHAVLGLNPDSVAGYWIDRRVRGGERPPRVVPTPSMMVRIVAALRGSVGYASPAAIDSSVKVIAKIVDGKVIAP